MHSKIVTWDLTDKSDISKKMQQSKKKLTQKTQA